MPRDPNIPDAFDVYTVVVLRRPADAPQMSDDKLDELQSRHLAFRAELRRQGVLVVNGPFDEQSDPSYLGMSIFACDAAEAARLSDGDLVLVGARPGQGKTLMSLELAVEAMKSGNRAVFFTLEYSERDVLDRLRAIGVEAADFNGRFEFDNSDDISADYIVAQLAGATTAVLV